MTAIDTWIADIQATRQSALSEPIKGPVSDCVAAWQFVAAAISGGSAFLPLAGGTMTGPIVLPNGSAGTPSLKFNDGGFFDDTGNAGIGVTIGGTELGFFNNLGLSMQVAGGAQMNVIARGEANSVLRADRYSADNLGPILNLVKGRGTIAAGAVPVLNDQLGVMKFSGWTGAPFVNTTGAQLIGTLVETGAVGSGAMGTQVRGQAAPIGSATLGNCFAFDTTGLYGFGVVAASIFLDANNLLRVKKFTVATLPTAVEGALASVTDATLTMITGLGVAPTGGGANHVPVFADNVGWKLI